MKQWIASWSLIIASAIFALPAFARDASAPLATPAAFQPGQPAAGAAAPKAPNYSDARLGFGRTEVVASSVLATQRGSGFSANMPILPSSKPVPSTILWDELKPGSAPANVSYGGGQSVNQINIKPR